MNNGRIRNLVRAGCVVGLLAIGAVTPPANATSLGSSQDAAVGDGDGTIALQPAPGTIRVLRDGDPTTVDVDVSASCLPRPVRVVAVGGGQVLFVCDAPNGDSDEPRLLDATTGEVRAVAGAQALIESAASNPHGGGVAFFTGVGSHGVRYGQAGGKLDSVGTVDWRTGATTNASGPDEVDDLDAVSLTTRLCAPLQRDPYEGGYFGDTFYAPFWLDGPIGLSAPVLNYGEKGSTLVLRRCDSSVRTVLQRSSGEGEGEAVRPLLGAGLVSWLDRTRGRAWSLTPRAHVVGCSRTYTWASQTHDVDGGPPDTLRTTHVADAVVISRWDGAAQAWRVERLSLARSCARAAAAERLVLAAGGRRITARALSGTIVGAASGGSTPVKRNGGGRGPTLRVSAGERVRLTTSMPASVVRWSVAGGPTRRASGRGRTWTLPVPATRRTRALRVVVRARGGGTVTFSARVTGVRR